MEIFKKIIGYEEIYEISNLGNVNSLRTNKLIKQHIGLNGYKTVALRKNSDDPKPKNYYVHRLLALTFIENKSNYPVVDHIDGNKLNNNLSNLRWSSYSENVKNGHLTNKNYNNKKKEVYKMDINDNIIDKYDSIKDAKMKNNYKFDTGIINCCKNKQQTYDNFKWKYVIDIKKKEFNDDEIFIKIDKIYDNVYSDYAISNYGKIFNIKKNIFYKLTNSSGYLKVSLIDNEGNKNYYKIHRLVAYFFIEKNDENKIVNHKDEDKLNNYFKNLEWLNDRGENVRYSMRKEICQIDPNTNIIINIYLTIKDAEKHLNLPIGNISKCINGKRKMAGGYIW
jgi:hypothetical protein